MGKKGKKKLDVGVLIAVIICFLFFCFGVWDAITTYSAYSGWDKVHPTYEEHNCETKLVTVSKDGKKAQEQETRCDLTVSYEYKGNAYKFTLENHLQQTIYPLVRYVDPAHPETAKEKESSYIMDGFFIILGLALTISGIVALRKK